MLSVPFPDSSVYFLQQKTQILFNSAEVEKITIRLVHLALALAVLLLGSLPPILAAAEIQVVTPEVLAARIESNKAPFILDVRTANERQQGYIPGSAHITHSELPSRLVELPADKEAEIVVYCYSGKRAQLIEELLLREGFMRVSDLQGHWKQWMRDGHPINND